MSEALAMITAVNPDSGGLPRLVEPTSVAKAEQAENSSAGSAADLGAPDAPALWYHTMDLGHGVVTPGWFDLRPIVDRMPWPDVKGKRCLDVGPWDGFLSFELERRGAAEVVATDISSPTEWDWQIGLRERGPEAMAQIAGSDPGAGFRFARDALGSRVERVESNVYDLSPDTVGTFDVVVCGSLMLHLKDPTRALEAIRSVCHGVFLSAEQISTGLTLASRRRPLARYLGGERGQWWIPNAAGHAALLRAGGFEILDSSRPYAIPIGPGHRWAGRAPPAQWVTDQIVTRGQGVPHVAALSKPLRRR